MPLLDSDETQQCPYNPGHEILVERFAQHIFKCRKSHPNSNLVICSFDSTHHVHKNVIDEHHKNCPGKNFFRFADRNDAEMVYKPPPANLNIPAPPGESWDDDVPVPTYDPLKAAREKDIVLSAKCQPKKALKQFRQAEKERRFNLKGKKDEEPKPEPEAEPLRKPENKGQGRGLLRSTIQARAARSPMPSRRLLTSDKSAYDALIAENYGNMRLNKF